MTYTSSYTRPTEEELEPAVGKISPLLYNLLTFKTPHGHEKLLHRFLPMKRATVDKLGNVIIDVGAFKEHKTIFSCHLDTVHPLPGMLEPCIHDQYVYARDSENKTASVLGADDKVGVYIMLRMISSKLRGRYIFHAGEEMGCKGAKYITTEKADVYKGAERAIAFDRKGYTDVIYQQLGDECASEEFTKELARRLNMTMPPNSQYSRSTGVWTDTAEYMYVVPEVTNLSVGYFNQHGTGEHFDDCWLENIFLPAVLSMDWWTLPTVRDCAKAKEKKENRYKQPVWHNPHVSFHQNKWGTHYKANTNTGNTKQKIPDDVSNPQPGRLDASKFNGITFNTPITDIPNIKPSNMLPDEYKDVELGIKAALFKRLQVAGMYRFCHEVFELMVNTKTLLNLLKRQAQELNVLKTEKAAAEDKARVLQQEMNFLKAQLVWWRTNGKEGQQPPEIKLLPAKIVH